MKEHVQKPGVRKWAGEDLIELQGESLSAIQALVEPYAPCIIQGCGVTQADGVYQVSPGIVALKGAAEDGTGYAKIVRFGGYSGKVMPIYLTVKVTPYMRVYADEENKPIAYDYEAASDTVKPQDASYLEITAENEKNARLVDTIGITQKLDREGGDASNTKVSFALDTLPIRTNITSGLSLSTIMKRIQHWFRDLGAMAFKSDVIKGDLNAALAAELDGKVTAVEGYGLSKNDFTDALRDKLNKIAVDSALSTTSANPVQNKVLKAALDSKVDNTEAGLNGVINKLSPGTDAPVDNDYYVAQYANGGTSITSYHRRKHSQLWAYIKGKAESLFLPLTGGTITGNLRLKGSGAYGNKLNFGDGEYVYLYEETDDNLTVKAKNIYLSPTTSVTAPTPSASDNSTKVATTAYVKNYLSNYSKKRESYPYGVNYYGGITATVTPGKTIFIDNHTNLYFTIKYPTEEELNHNNVARILVVDGAFDDTCFTAENSSMTIYKSKSSNLAQDYAHLIEIYWITRTVVLIEYRPISPF